MEWGLVVIGLLLLLKAILYGLAWSRLMRLRNYVTEIRLMDEHEKPAELGPIFFNAEQAMSKLGFQYACMLVTSGKRNYISRVYIHPETNTFANISPSIQPGWVRPFIAQFISLLGDGSILTTTDCLRHLLMPTPPKYINQDVYQADLELQWQAHQDRLNSLADVAPPIPFMVDEYVNYEKESIKELMAYRIEQGWIKPLANGQQWKYTASGALKFVWKINAGAKKTNEAIKRINARSQSQTFSQPQPAAYLQSAPQAQFGPFDNAQTFADVAAFERMVEAEQSRKWSWLAKVALFLFSVLIFTATFGLGFSWRTLPILMAVLFIHELGHLCGMIMFGYKDRQILFVPLMGAVTIGKKDDATTMEKLIIYLLGPLPGIILGFISLYFYCATSDRLFFEIGLYAVILNYINLIPILPLDGGRIIEALIFARFPRAQLLLSLISVLALGLMGLLFHGQILLIIAGISAIALPLEWRLSKAAKIARKNLSPRADRKEKLHAIFNTLSLPQFRNISITNRVQMAKSLLARFAQPVPAAGAIVLGLAIYFASIALPIALPVGYFIAQYRNPAAIARIFSLFGGQPYHGRQTQPEPNWQAKLADAKTAEDRWKIYMDAGQWQKKNVYDFNKARVYFQNALSETKEFDAKDTRDVDTLVALAEVCGSHEDGKKYYYQAITRLEAAKGPNDIQIAEILERTVSFAYEDEDYSSDVKLEDIETLERAVRIRVANGQEKSGETGRSLQFLANCYQQAGRNNEAEEAMQKAVAIFHEDKSKYFNMWFSAADNLADIYVKNGKVDAAKNLLQDCVTECKTTDDTGKRFWAAEIEAHLGWLLIDQNDLAAAKNIFEDVVKYQNNLGTKKPKGYPLDWQSYLDLCYVELRLGNFEAAKNDYKKTRENFAGGSFVFDQYMKSLDKFDQQMQSQNSQDWRVKRYRAHSEVYQKLKGTTGFSIGDYILKFFNR